ncbi:MAG: hypothetical protein KW793_00115 [Candidatus Doudnabacteria bacterium]|nr:hypothetical protein [Candidatus Doudnabacteria bacterium]
MSEQRSNNIESEIEEQRRELHRQNLDTAADFLAGEEKAASAREHERGIKDKPKFDPDIPGITREIRSTPESQKWSVDTLNESMERGKENIEHLEQSLDNVVKGKSAFNPGKDTESLGQLMDSENE